MWGVGCILPIDRVHWGKVCSGSGYITAIVNKRLDSQVFQLYL